MSLSCLQGVAAGCGRGVHYVFIRALGSMLYSWELGKHVFTGLGKALSCLGYGLKSAMNRRSLAMGLALICQEICM